MKRQAMALGYFKVDFVHREMHRKVHSTGSLAPSALCMDEMTRRQPLTEVKRGYLVLRILARRVKRLLQHIMTGKPVLQIVCIRQLILAIPMSRFHGNARARDGAIRVSQASIPKEACSSIM